MRSGRRSRRLHSYFSPGHCLRRHHQPHHHCHHYLHRQHRQHGHHHQDQCKLSHSQHRLLFKASLSPPPHFATYSTQLYTFSLSIPRTTSTTTSTTSFPTSFPTSSITTSPTSSYHSLFNFQPNTFSQFQNMSHFIPCFSYSLEYLYSALYLCKIDS